MPTPRRKKAVATSSSTTTASSLALLAGALGAVAAASGKLSGHACPALFPVGGGGGGLGEGALSFPLLPPWLTPQLACRSALLGLLLAANLSATGLLLRALSLELPSLQATVLSNASNLAATGALSALLFGEPVTPRWAAGVATVGAGLWLISRAAAPSADAGRRPRAPPRRGATPAAAAAATPARRSERRQ